ncbi:229_t:CDS:2 [Gigaspora margarita]|uniref:229_t:CDS:1 n=1 Tax=Gigaspora margarita TaxID=4874 RepID=A0ABM8W447_GIGMA|nr:229_t:CDS:2 [Gigaspora margarita]
MDKNKNIRLSPSKSALNILSTMISQNNKCIPLHEETYVAHK